MEKQFQSGDKVIWYKNGEQIRATVLKITPKRIKIELVGSDHKSKIRYVKTKNLYHLQEIHQEIRPPVHPKSFQEFLNRVSFQEHGDEYERDFGHYVSENFPNCEIFWRMFVVPITKRVNGYPNGVIRDINFRQSIHEDLMNIASAHYSMFFHLICAHQHLETKILSSLEDFYTHLVSVCDLAEKVIVNWHLLVLKCRGEMSPVFQELKLEQFLKLAEKWYNKSYPGAYEHYLKKGKFSSMALPQGTDLIKEYFSQEAEILKEYNTFTKHTLRPFRNIIVHDVKVGRIIVGDDKVALIPKPQKIGNYKTWRKVEAVAGDKAIIKRDFVEQCQQSKEDLSRVEELINVLWNKIINDFEKEFYSQERTVLRELFNVVFSHREPRQTQVLGLYTPKENSDVMISGSYLPEEIAEEVTGGSAVFNTPK